MRASDLFNIDRLRDSQYRSIVSQGWHPRWCSVAESLGSISSKKIAETPNIPQSSRFDFGVDLHDCSVFARDQHQSLWPGQGIIFLENSLGALTLCAVVGNVARIDRHPESAYFVARCVLLVP